METYMQNVWDIYTHFNLLPFFRRLNFCMEKGHPPENF
jgi:hypothetical protein